MAALAITVEQTRSADHHVRHRLADRARAAAVDALADRLTALRPWQGTADDLVGLPCPGPDRMQHWRAARGEAEATLARHQSETERLTTLVRHLVAERASLSSTTGVVTDQEAAEISDPPRAGLGRASARTRYHIGRCLRDSAAPR
ncbi:hypothetical protein ACFSKM_01760 [Ancylobacter dichloromethanicus]